MATVLVVEDESGQAEILTMLFTLEGFEVMVAVNGQDALTLLDRIRPDVIVTDFLMPAMNGGEMAKHVRASPRHFKVPIVMTSATDAQQVEQHSEHYDAFLRKPYLWEDLLARVRQVLTPPPDI